MTTYCFNWPLRYRYELWWYRYIWTTLQYEHIVRRVQFACLTRWYKQNTKSYHTVSRTN